MHIIQFRQLSIVGNLVSFILLFTFLFSPDYFEAKPTYIILNPNILVLSLKDKDSFYKLQICYLSNGKELRM